MTFEKDRAKHLKVAYIGGGSRGWAWGFMTDLAMDPDMGGEVRLYDIDESAARRNEIIGNKIMAHPDANGCFVSGFLSCRGALDRAARFAHAAFGCFGSFCRLSRFGRGFDGLSFGFCWLG